MKAWKRLIAAAGLTLGVWTLLAAVSTDARAQAPAVDPAALQALKRMTDFVDGQQKFSVTAQSVREELHVFASNRGTMVGNSSDSAGTTVTKDVPRGALALTRVKQVNVEGWADRFREANARRKKTGDDH